MAAIQKLRIAHPGLDLTKGVGPGDEEDVGRGRPPEPVSRSSVSERVGRAVAVHLNVRCHERGAVRDGQRHHREAVGRRDVRRLAVRRNPGRDEQHPFESEGAAGGLRDVEVAQVDGVERAAEQAAAGHAAGGSACEATCFHIASSSLGSPSPVAAEMRIERHLQLLQMLLDLLQPLRLVERIDLVRHRDARLVRQRHRGVVAGAGELLELTHDHVEVFHRIAPRARRHVDHMHQHLRPFEMREELRPQAVTLMRAFDQAWHVGDDKRAVAGEFDDPEVRCERRERVIGDFRTRF